MKIPLPVEFDEEFYDLMHIQRNNVGILQSDSVSVNDPIDFKLTHYFTRSALDSFEMDALVQLVTALHPTSSNYEINSTYYRYASIIVGEKVFGSSTSRSRNSNKILAELLGEICPAKIRYLTKISLLVDEFPIIRIL